MANSQTFTFYCYIPSKKNPFPIVFETNKTVGELKKAIKKERKEEDDDTFQDVAAEDLTLRKIDKHEEFGYVARVPHRIATQEPSHILHDFEPSCTLDDRV